MWQGLWCKSSKGFTHQAHPRSTQGRELHASALINAKSLGANIVDACIQGLTALRT
jgi:hypothetical protein